MKGDVLERELLPRNLRPEGGILVLAPADAIHLVRRAADEGVAILGVDGFFISEAGIQPSMDNSVDYSARVAGGQGCWEDAEAYIRERSGRMSGFEVVLGDDPVKVV